MVDGKCNKCGMVETLKCNKCGKDYSNPIAFEREQLCIICFDDDFRTKRALRKRLQ